MKNTFIGANYLDAKAAFEIWAQNYIKENKNKINIKVVTTVYEDISSLFYAVKKKEIEFINLNTIDFIRISEQININGYLVNSNRNSPTDELLLLVSRQSSIKKIKDLKNKKIVAQTGKWGEIPNMWLDTLLLDEKIELSEKSIKETDKASQAVYQVYFNQADACIVSSASYKLLTELNPKITENLNSLCVSPDFIPFIFCHINSADTGIMEIINKSVFTFEKSAYGKQILTLFQTNKIFPFKNEYIVNTKKLFEKYNKLLQGKKNQ